MMIVIFLGLAKIVGMLIMTLVTSARKRKVGSGTYTTPVLGFSMTYTTPGGRTKSKMNASTWPYPTSEIALVISSNKRLYKGFWGC
jgi:hypothetical protein